MKLLFILFVINGLAVSAAVVQRDKQTECCFSIIARGTINGPVGQDSIGENGVGTEFPQSVYCISNGTLTNDAGQPCAILSSNGQFVCEASSTPTTSRFTLAENGNLLHDGSPYYLACQSPSVANDGSHNIFSDSIADARSCTGITLLTGGFSCAALGRPSSTTTYASTATSAQLEFATTATPVVIQSPTRRPPSCPTDISQGTYLAPNLIVPVSPSSPDAVYGTQYTATITPSNSTIFVFDIPHTYTGSCALLFLFPTADDAQFPYTFSGTEEESSSPGAGLDFALLDGKVDDGMSWASRPPLGADYSVVEIAPGENYTIAVEPCAAGRQVGYQVSSAGGVLLEFFQSRGRSPLGVWVVPCA